LSAEQRLAKLGIVLPEASNPAAAYTNYVIINGLMFVAGKGPTANSNGGIAPRGKLGNEYSVSEGYQFARQAGIEVLAVLKSALGSLERVKRVVKVQGFVNANPAFDKHHKVLDGCSELFSDVFGERGSHARSVMGANSLRDNLPIVIDTIFAVEED
jgi:enamine deaminase RidA (YjgF/YER057c/UK114 family)